MDAALREIVRVAAAVDAPANGIVDHYIVLAVARSAAAAEIRAQYRKYVAPTNLCGAFAVFLSYTYARTLVRV
jgi:type IV pilus biogenesis protein CpaD/CtpE